MSLFPPSDANTSEDDFFRLSLDDVNEPLSAHAKFDFHLDDAHWPSVEHYVQAMKFVNPEFREKIRLAEHPNIAQKLGNARFKKKRKDWNQVRETVMTRGVYTKCRTHEEVASRLLATGDKKIIETSAYDYYWGCGRDGRGHNTYGKVLTNVRKKLREEQLPDNN